MEQNYITRTMEEVFRDAGLLNWAKYQRKRIKENTMPADQQALFGQLMNSRTTGAYRR